MAWYLIISNQKWCNFYGGYTFVINVHIPVDTTGMYIFYFWIHLNKSSNSKKGNRENADGKQVKHLRKPWKHREKEVETQKETVGNSYETREAKL